MKPSTGISLTSFLVASGLRCPVVCIVLVLRLFQDVLVRYNDHYPIIIQKTQAQQNEIEHSNIPDKFSARASPSSSPYGGKKRTARFLRAAWQGALPAGAGRPSLPPPLHPPWPPRD
eukprot:GHVT01031220.1.p1 GENE.GHVT01031220.1~~GHVT01031220.1.p1  ORF type:complete len:117 (-),score=9.04 GHVT01031220.1:159-509(-)